MDHKVSKDMISSGMIPSGEKTQADLGRTQYGSTPSPNTLLDAYKSMYGKKDETINEHHKKDADGNTIPHEGEELNEFIGVALGGLTKVVGGLAGKAAVGAGAKTAAAGATKAAAAGAGKAAAGAAGKTAMTTGAKVTGSGGQLMQTPAVKKGLSGAVDKFNKMDSFQKFQTYQMGKDALNTAGAAAQGVKGATTVRKKGTGTVSADVDLFDIVKGHLLDEGYNEKEANEIMVNLTEEQLDEILGALAKAGMRGAEAVGRATKPLAKAVGEYGKGLGKPPAPKRKPFDPVSKPTEPVKTNAAPKKTGNGDINKMVDAVSSRKKEVEKEKQAKREKLTKMMSANEGSDLFDIVKGQLLDEGLSEEEIKDIMLTLTPDEILKEIEESSMSDGSAGGAYQDLGPQGGFRSKEQINRMHNDPKGTEKYGKKLMKRVGQAVRDTGTPTVRKVDESKK